MLLQCTLQHYIQNFFRWQFTKVWVLQQVILERWNSDQLNQWWTLFSTYLSSKLDYPSPMFWLEENLILFNVLINEEYNFDEKYVEKIVLHWFNWSEFHLSKMTCYKIHTLTMSLNHWSWEFLRAECYIDLISLKIQIVGGNLFKNPEFKSPSGMVIFCFCFYFHILHKKLNIDI